MKVYVLNGYIKKDMIINERYYEEYSGGMYCKA